MTYFFGTNFESRMTFFLDGGSSGEHTQCLRLPSLLLHDELELIVGHWIVEGCKNFRRRRRVGAHREYTSRLRAYFWDLWTNATTPVPSRSSTSSLDTNTRRCQHQLKQSIMQLLQTIRRRGPKFVKNNNFLNLPNQETKPFQENSWMSRNFSPEFKKASPELIPKSTWSINWN